MAPKQICNDLNMEHNIHGAKVWACDSYQYFELCLKIVDNNFDSYYNKEVINFANNVASTSKIL